ncbi:MAG: hypothetical protein VKP62_02870 [Candidatus Sericytochromatia bacterium]|nr:hypothetical protein [Candidatus Sericytochromatia bacterium]
MTQPVQPQMLAPSPVPLAPPTLPPAAPPAPPVLTDAWVPQQPPVVTVAVPAAPPSTGWSGGPNVGYGASSLATPGFLTAPNPGPAAPVGIQATPGVAYADGPLLQTGAAGMMALGARALPSGTAAAVGAATAIARNSNATMAKGVAAIVESAGEPLLKLSWALVGNAFDVVGSLLTFQFGRAIQAFGKIFSEGAVSLGALGKKVAQPISLTAATHGGQRLGLGQAIGAGVSGGLKALKSSAVWAIPASALNAFVDYKYRDQSDVKRLGTNFAADVVGYTATGMAGAAVGATIGSMTLPIVGTVVGALVGITLGLVHDRVSRPLISDMIYDSL